MSTETKFVETFSTQTFPHRNIRNVLSLQSKVSPEKPFIIHYRHTGVREEFVFSEINARAHQTANLLQEDFAVKPGDHVAIWVNEPVNVVVFYLACWILGAVAVPLYLVDSDDIIASYFRDIRPVMGLVSIVFLERAQRLIQPECQLVQIGDSPHDDVPYFNKLVKNMPNTFFNDHPEPALDSPALWISEAVVRSQGDLLFAAQNLAFAQAFTGNQRIMTLLPLYDASEIILSLLMPLLVGGSVVIDSYPEDLWRIVTAERVQIASVSPQHLRRLIDLADARIKLGEPIWGVSVHQQDLTRFRHLICADPNLDPALIKTFQERLGLAVYGFNGLF